MKLVGPIIGVMISIVVGVSLIPTIRSTIASLPEETTSGVMGTLLNILPYIFIAVIMLGAVVWIGSSGELGGDKEKKQIEARVEIKRNDRKLILLLTEESKPLDEYINNLDAVLGVKTANVNSHTFGGALSLHDNILHIDNSYDWYLVDKHPDMVMFKIVGLNKKDASKNVVYVVGNNDGEPYLFQIPSEQIEERTKKWIELALTKV